ncbi:DUF6215 domain-containing protein [Kitasatospora sp. NPDC090091]|uniref:DUF6215 domain-containing protein n=1 Tax=Kitasatospora sp. NPDC090091 TaxID=3364081 RepID=UPI00380B2779
MGSSIRGRRGCTRPHTARAHRPDFPALAGMPTEHVSNAQSGGGQITFADGTKKLNAAAEVQIGTLQVRIADLHDLTVRDYLVLGGGTATRTTLLDHPAMTYSDRTTAVYFNLGGGKTSTGPGGIARHLVVGKDSTADGGSYELTIWHQDSAVPDDAALFRIAEKVLPTLQGWTASR